MRPWRSNTYSSLFFFFFFFFYGLADFNFPVTTTGRYVVAASISNSKAPMVSDEATVSRRRTGGIAGAERNEFQDRTSDRRVQSGREGGAVDPGAFRRDGVGVGRDRIRFSTHCLVPLSGNAGRIELPIKRGTRRTRPFRFISLGQAATNRCRWSVSRTSEIQVNRPDRQLKIESHLASASVKPGENVHGELRVTSEAKPVADADLAVFAVDDAVLKLGDWNLPNVLENFYPRNPFSVRNYQSLENYVEEITERSLTQKGFIIGGGGEEASAECEKCAEGI